MPVILNAEIIRQKNALHGGSPFLLLLEIHIPGIDEALRVVMNTEDIHWRGKQWQAIQFEIDEIEQGTEGEVPQVELRIANPERVLEPYVDMYDTYIKRNGFEPVTVHLYVINTAELSSGAPVVDHEYELKAPECSADWVTFTLGASNPFDWRFPQDRILKAHCRFRFRDRRCNYKGAAASCAHTLADCRAKGNSARFGGFPGIGRAGLYLTEM